MKTIIHKWSKSVMAILMAIIVFIAMIPQTFSSADENTATPTDATASTEEVTSEEVTTEEPELLAGQTVHLYAGAKNDYGSVFYIDDGTPAYCGDHHLNRPKEGDYPCRIYTNERVRKVMYYALTELGFTGKDSGTTAERVNVSIATHYAKRPGDCYKYGNLGKMYYEEAMKLDAPITREQSALAFETGKTKASLTASAVQDVEAGGKQIELKVTDSLKIVGSSVNDIPIKLPDGLYLKYNNKWYRPGSTVTVKGNAKIRFGVKPADTGKYELKNLKGKTGIDVFEIQTGTSSMQYLYFGRLSQSSLSISIEGAELPDAAYLQLSKESKYPDVTSGDINYNFAGIRYVIYSDAACIDEVYSDSHNVSKTNTNQIKRTVSLAVSYNGKVYMDGNGNNVVFVNRNSYMDFDSKYELHPFRWYKSLTEKTTYYYKEASNTLSYNTDMTARKYYYDDGTAATQNLIKHMAGKPVPDVTGYEVNQAVNSFELHKSDTQLSALVKATDTPLPFIRFEKAYATEPGSECNYSLSGAEYEIYVTTGNDEAPLVNGALDQSKLICKVTTDASGKGYFSNVKSGYTALDSKNGRYYAIRGVENGTWLYIHETKASEGCEIAKDTYFYVDSSKPVTVTSKEPIKIDPLTISIKKMDAVNGADVKLAGAQFRLNYYDVNVKTVTSLEKLLALDLQPTRSWIFETDVNGLINTREYAEYYVSGDELYINDYGEAVIPYGALTVEEIKAPEGYTKEGSYIISDKDNSISSDNGIIFTLVTEDRHAGNFNTENAQIIKNEVSLRADLELKKTDKVSGEGLSGIAFKLTSKTTGESHILVTDESGIIDTSVIPHSTDTNINDAATADEYKACGTWFYGNKECIGNVFDEYGALAPDVYTLSELKTKANEKYVLMEDIQIDLTDYAAYNDNGYLCYDLGDVTNMPEPSIRTKAMSNETGDATVPADRDVACTDTVTYINLPANKEFTLKSVVIDKSTGKVLADGKGNYVTGIKTFTTSESYNGTVTVPFKMNTTGLAGKSFVVFEYLFEGKDDAALLNTDGSINTDNVYEVNGRKIMHADISDEDQTLKVPVLKTTLTTDKGNHTCLPSKNTKLTDKVKCSNLIIGKEYKVSGTLYKKSDKTALLDEKGNKITASKTFTATDENITVDIVFTFDSSLLAGDSVVAFEDLSKDNIDVASHADINDEGQTVDFPKGHTLAREKGTNAKVLKAKKTEVVDTIYYENIPVDMEITVTGTAVDVATGKALTDNRGNVITKTVTFFADEKTDSVDVEFKLDGKKLAGKKVVFFEKMTCDGELIFTHEDLNDEDQTVEFEKLPDSPQTGDSAKILIMSIICFLAATFAGVLFFIRLRRK